ncbi:MAG: hypothetical protein CFK52_04505 [Chloracidobacterium sp. CP2_5A]|nr:MAG: hypothetical protein CFK52_04505 [Chloracidobacterium sp. CP2_5A]
MAVAPNGDAWLAGVGGLMRWRAGALTAYRVPAGTLERHSQSAIAGALMSDWKALTAPVSIPYL